MRARNYLRASPALPPQEPRNKLIANLGGDGPRRQRAQSADRQLHLAEITAAAEAQPQVHLEAHPLSEAQPAIEIVGDGLGDFLAGQLARQVVDDLVLEVVAGHVREPPPSR